MKELFSNFGTMSRFLMPDNNSIALISFISETHAKNAFSKMHDFTIHGTPLYLEWAPAALFEDKQQEGKESLLKKRSYQEILETSEASENEKSRTLFLKNLNFETVEEDLEALFKKNRIDNIKNIRIVKKEEKSMGFGFIEFGTIEDARHCLKKMQGTLLQDHLLRFALAKKPEAKKVKKSRRETVKVKESAKLLIKNLAFQANAKELRELISPISELRSLRLPKKVSGELRGFGFAEFADIESAKKAMQYLSNVHFYGRKLVVLFAKQK